MRVTAGALILLLAAAAAAADFRAGPDDYRSYLPHLRAGDRLILEGGDYLRGLPLENLEGRHDRPIVVEGPAEGRRARFIARPGANTVSLADVSHVVIRNLELDGRDIPVDGVKAEGHAHFANYVTLENLYIHDFRASQQNVGISSKCPAFGWVIRGNRIERVGTGMYLGNSDGTDPFVAGLIEGNQVVDTVGYNLQVKHQISRPADMPEAGGRHDTVIRHNLFSKVGAMPGPNARPNVLVGHFPRAGEGGEDRYLVYANLFWQNPSESLFQGEGNVALYDNVFVNAEAGRRCASSPTTTSPSRSDVFQNTVLAPAMAAYCCITGKDSPTIRRPSPPIWCSRPPHWRGPAGGQSERPIRRGGANPAPTPMRRLGQLDLARDFSPCQRRFQSACVRYLEGVDRDFPGKLRPAWASGGRVLPVAVRKAIAGWVPCAHGRNETETVPTAGPCC